VVQLKNESSIWGEVLSNTKETKNLGVSFSKRGKTIKDPMMY
jgi:hypothetical protein